VRRLGLLALLVIAAMGALAGWLDSQLSRPYRGHRPERIFVDIPHGTSRWGVAGILRSNDAIRNRFAFFAFSEWHFRKPLMAGEYLIDRSMTSHELFWKIARGDIFVHIVTVPEGWTSFDIANELDRQKSAARKNFLSWRTILPPSRTSLLMHRASKDSCFLPPISSRVTPPADRLPN